MHLSINETHDPQLRSWVQSANVPGVDFPIQNLPLGVFRRLGAGGPPRMGVAIGDQILDVAGCLEEKLLEGKAAQAAEACRSGSLNGLMALNPAYRFDLRLSLSRLLRSDSPRIRSNPELVRRLLVPTSNAELILPAAIGDYTDFYASIYHATNVGSMFRPDNPLLPNYKYVPVAYHGRSSSIVISGTPVRRPSGQARAEGCPQPGFGPSRELDYELEVGFFIGPGNALGMPIPIGAALERVVGFCLLNDWSARDIQRWEYQPLGPFLAKSFATSISPWIVTLDALQPFRTTALQRPEGDPKPLPHLFSEEDAACGGFDLCLEVFLTSREMRRSGIKPVRLSIGNFKNMYWTTGQLLAHHASNGCNLRSGDLIASGTVSGPEKESRGCLLELTCGGAQPVLLPTGEQRRFLEDDDEVILRGSCRHPGFVGIGFGECRGTIQPAAHS